MTSEPTSRPLAPTEALDRALGALAQGGDALDEALRLAAPVLASNDSQAVAADVLARALEARGRAAGARLAYEASLAFALRQGLVTTAVCAALGLRRASDKKTSPPKGEAPLRAVARAFGADAPEGPAVPPPSLVPEAFAPLPAALTGAALYDRCEALLREHAPSAASDRDERPPRPRLPLWGALTTDAFERFAEALEPRVLPAGAVLLREGEPGHSAFVLVRGEVRVSRGAGAGAVALAALGPGAIVGEMALVTAAPRAATVTAASPVLVLEAPRAALDEAARDVPAVGALVAAFCRRRLVDNVLRTSAILREVPASEREGLVQHFETRTYEPGEALVREGETGAGLHLLAVGAVEVVHRESSGDALRLARLGPGGCVGEISLVLRRPATASVLALEPSVSLVLPAERFMDIVRQRPTLLARLYELAVRRQDETLSVLAQAAEEIDDAVLV